MIQKVVFPSFRENEYSQYDMRQLVSALELRFQSLESNVEGFFPTSADADFDDRYAAAVHTHLVADIIDFDANVPSSIFDLDDVTGTASVGQGLIWNGAEFVAGPLGGSTNLNDLLDVNAPSPSDGEALVWDVSTLRWVPGTASGGGGDSLFGLTDTDLAGQLQGDLLFNANGTEWQSTGWKFQWVDDQYLQFGNGIGINWYDAAFSTVELLSFAGVAASPTATAWAPLADYVSDGEANTVFSTNSSLSIRFNNDGTKVTVCRDTGGTGQDIRVNSPAWSVGYQNEDETAPVRIYEGANFFDQMRDTCWNDDGTKLFLLRGIGGVDGLANAGTPFNPVSGDLSIAETLAVAGGATANAIDFKPDGTTFWIGSSASGGSGGVLQYDMSTPWDVSTGVLGVSYVPTEAIISRGLRFDPSGRKFWVMDNVDNIREYSMTVDWDITSAVYVSVVDFSAYVPAGAINSDGAWGFDVSPDGTVLVVFFFDAASGSDCQIARFTSDGGAFNAPIVDTFTVGDPGYTTNIEGSPVLINGLPIDTNATHTGEVTGATALTLDVTAISNQTFVEADALDNAAIEDDTDGTLKKTTLSSITDGGFF